MEGKRKRIYRLVAVCLALLVAFTGLLTVQAAGVAKPTKLSAKVNDNVSITLQWTATKKVSGYQVYTAGSKSGKYTLLATTSATKYTHSNLKGGKTYYYKVRAYKTVKKKEAVFRLHGGGAGHGGAVRCPKEPAKPEQQGGRYDPPGDGAGTEQDRGRSATNGASPRAAAGQSAKRAGDLAKRPLPPRTTACSLCSKR